MRERLPLRFNHIILRHHVFRLWFQAWNLLYVTSLQKQENDVSLVLKDSDMELKKLSSLIRLALSHGQKTVVQKSYHS